jgi:hypothetical protein
MKSHLKIKFMRGYSKKWNLPLRNNQMMKNLMMKILTLEINSFCNKDTLNIKNKQHFYGTHLLQERQNKSLESSKRRWKVNLIKI